MNLVSPTKGLKTRTNALTKLRKHTEHLLAARGTILANEDGTFTPCVFLTGDETRYARPLAEAGIYVIA